MSRESARTHRRAFGAMAGALGAEPQLILDAIVLGVLGALGARFFVVLLDWANALFLERWAGYRAPGLPNDGGALGQSIGPHGLWLIPVVTTVGGLLSGALVYGLAPEAEGHGTDTVVKAYHQAGGFIRARVPPLKTLASALTIGSGGSAGREGPTALIVAGLGSLYATVTRQGDAERRLLVVIGMAAGLSAVFRSPIGTALFAIEVLYSDMEFEASALLYAMLAAVVAYSVNGAVRRLAPAVRRAGRPHAARLSRYPWYAALGRRVGRRRDDPAERVLPDRATCSVGCRCRTS